MAEIVSMPRLSDTMEEGTVAKWHKSIGDTVEEGDVLAEIETDKATMEFEAFQEGTLLHIGVEEGDTAPVDSMLAVLGEEGEDISAILEEEGSEEKSSSKDEKEEAEEKPSEEKKEGQSKEKSQKDQTKNETPSGNHDANKRIKVSPLAKKLAEDKGINLKEIKGSGEGGRIVKRDIDEYKPNAAKQQSSEPAAEVSLASAGEPTADMQFEEVNVSQMRKTIAKRLAASKFSAPHFYLTLDIDMDQAIAARKRINEVSEQKISFNDFVVKASAGALKQHPVINSSWAGDKIRRNHTINIGVAVAVEEGLLVPVIKNTDQKGLTTINAQVKELASKARDKKLQPEEWEGNTFTISNLGMFGIEEFTAIINAPDSCILAVGGIKQVPVVKNGEVVPGNVMKVTLSCDHRVVDGASGAAFLQTLKQLLEDPMRMLL
jgi:pyruvate dehydrogenase E2 component (dihydrolipoamide acetyltransferase)